MARKTPEQAALTRQQIIEAAVRVFSRDGIAGSSLESIAREAGVTRGAIYWHFEGKQGLLQALLSEQLSPFEQGLPQGEGFEAGWRQLRQALEDTMNAGMSRQLSRILLHNSERVTEDDPVVVRLQQIRGAVIRQLQVLLRSAVTDGELVAELDIEQVGAFFQSCIAGLLFDCLQQPGSNPERGATMLDTLYHLLQHPPAHWLHSR